MPLTPELRRGIEQIRDYLYGGGYPDPMSNAEQLSFLFFFYLVEGLDSDNLMLAKANNREYASMFAGDWVVKNPLNAPGSATVPANRLRWSQWSIMAGEPFVRWIRDEVFPFYAEVADQSAMNFMTGARLGIDEPTVLAQVVGLIDGLQLGSSRCRHQGRFV